jgi:hypothetical protein
MVTWQICQSAYIQPNLNPIKKEPKTRIKKIGTFNFFLFHVSKFTSEAAASDALQDFPDGSSGPRSSSSSSSVVDGGISMGLTTISAVLSNRCSSKVSSLSWEFKDKLYRAGADARLVDELDD